MKILSCFIAVVALSGTFVNAWDASEKCHDLGKYRQLEGGHLKEKPRVVRDVSTLETHRQIEEGHLRERPQDEGDKAVVSMVDTNRQLRLDSSKNLRGYDHRNLGLLTFQVKLHWEQEYCWQAEWSERKWCMSCYGGSCSDEDAVWIQDCNDAIVQRFVWEPVEIAGRSKTGKLKPYTRQDLCLENVGSEGNYGYFLEQDYPRWWHFILRNCSSDNVETQILEGYDFNKAFKLLSFNATDKRPERCVTMPHHPRAGEALIGENCEIACDRDNSCLWDVHNAHSDLPATPSKDTSEFCAPQLLMKSNEVVEGGNTIVNWDADTYVEQSTNGRFVIRRGFPDRPGAILVDSKVDKSEGNYFTKQQQDGNLITFEGTPDDKGDSLWKINAKGAVGQYFVGIECDLETVSIYEYVPEDPGELMWSSGKYTPGSDSGGGDTGGGDTGGGDTGGGDTGGGDTGGGDTAGGDTAAGDTDGRNDPKVVSRGKDYCDTNICGLCEGDCDSDDQCEATLKCLMREPNQPVPGCSGGSEVEATTSFCYKPNS